MPTYPRLTKTIIEKEILPQQQLLGGKDQRFFWDARLAGFGLKLSATKAVYIVQGRVEDKTVRFILGGYAEFGTPDLAKDAAGARIQEMRKGAHLNKEKKAASVSRNSATLRDLLDDYLETYDLKLRPKTKQVYRSAVERCFKSWLDMRVGDISENMIATRQVELSNANGPRGKGEAQANQAMRVLRTLFNHAIETYRDTKGKPVVASNPVKTLKARRLWNRNVSRSDVIQDDELAAWYAAVSKLDKSTIRDYMLLCLFTGLRRGEASRLKWSSVRLTGPRPVLKISAEDTKTGMPHELPLSDVVLEILKRRDKVRKIDNPFVFPGEKPGSCIVEPKRAIAKVVEESGVDFSMHTLRRTFGTIAGRLDIAHYKHKMLMNHSMKTEVTGDHYVKLSVEDLREPMQQICNYIRKAIGADLVSPATTESTEA